MNIKVKIDNEIIGKSIRHYKELKPKCHHCPVTLGVIKALQKRKYKFSQVYTTLLDIVIYNEYNNTESIISLHSEITKLIQSFDTSYKMPEFSFTIYNLPKN